MTVLFIVMVSVLALGLVLVSYGTLAKNNWGINLDRVSCPRCKTALPQVRVPRTRRETIWGGWTCPTCRAEVDKWGRELGRE